MRLLISNEWQNCQCPKWNCKRQQKKFHTCRCIRWLMTKIVYCIQKKWDRRRQKKSWWRDINK